jgi:beta-lactamase class A
MTSSRFRDAVLPFVFTCCLGFAQAPPSGRPLASVKSAPSYEPFEGRARLLSSPDLVSQKMWARQESRPPGIRTRLTAGEQVRKDKAALQELVDTTAATTLERFADRKFQSNQLAVTLIDLREVPRPAWASYHGDAEIYPASVIKLFYLVAAHRWLEEGKLQDTPELRRALRDMIVDSSNDATHYVVDLLTGTTSGPELPDEELEAWFEKRNAVNRYFRSLGYTSINANKKPWCEGPYGRERQSIQRHQPNRNLLTTDATARLLLEIVTGQAVTASRSAEMLQWMERDPRKPMPADCEPDQAKDFTGAGLPPGAKLWSKAGWTSTVRHDAAYVELPGGARFILVTFTVGHSHEREILATVVRRIVEGMGGGSR